MRMPAIYVVLITVCLGVPATVGQPQTADGDSATTYCTFSDGMELTARYMPTVKDEPHNGKVWLPGGTAMTLFSQAPISFNNVPIPVGAYTMYVIPNRKDWTLIVSKNTNTSAPYDQKDDVARGPMELGEVETPPKQLQVSFAHTGPKKCGIRLYYGKTGAFADFMEQ